MTRRSTPFARGAMADATEESGVLPNFDARSAVLFAVRVAGGRDALATDKSSAATPQDVDLACNRSRNDTDHDGRLSPQEARALPAVSQRLAATDKNRDRFIARGELGNAVTQ